MIAARKFILDLLFIKYLVLRWEINIRKGKRPKKKPKNKKIQETSQAAGPADGKRPDTACL